MVDRRLLVERMDRRLLVERMLEYEDLQRKLDIVKRDIQEAVLKLEETLTVGNVKATYRRGRKRYNYKKVGVDAPASVIAPYTEVKTVIQWRDVVLKGMEIKKDKIPFTQGEPSVSIVVI